MTEAVHAHGGRIALQILHAGRYAKIAGAVGPSSIASPINPNAPRRMSEADILRTIEDYARPRRWPARPATTASRSWARRAISSTSSRRRAPTTAPMPGAARSKTGCVLHSRSCAACAQRTGSDFLVIFRVSSIDLVEGGLTREEIAAEARAVEAAGADIINQGIGWHEARVPTIAQHVPRAAWASRRAC